MAAPTMTEVPVPAPSQTAWPRWFKPGTVLLWIVSIGVLVYLFIPLVTIAVFTFNDPSGKFNTRWEGFTLDNWAHPFAQRAFTDALIESIRVAAVACTLATVLGSLIALALGRYRMHGSAAINLLIVLPLTTPEIVMGASLFTLFFNLGATRGFWTVVIAHTLFCLSFVAMTVKARTRGMDWSLEDAALDLGSSPMRTFWRVTFPGILPGVAGAFLLSLALSIDDYIITSFVAGPTVTFPRRVFDSARIALPPQVHVLATIIMMVAIGIIVASTLTANRREALVASPVSTEWSPKSRRTAGLLGCFFGGLGVHSFYLGKPGRGVAQIVVSILTAGLGSLWGQAEGVFILFGRKTQDGKGRWLRD